MLSGPLVQTIIAELAPRTGQATYQAAFGVVNDLKDAAGPQSAPGSMRSRPDCRGRAAPSYRLPPRSAWRWRRAGMTKKRRKNFSTKRIDRPASPDDLSRDDYPSTDRRRGAIESRPHSRSASSQAISSRCVNRTKFSAAAICASCAVIVEI
jgi:hypothetical protein